MGGYSLGQWIEAAILFAVLCTLCAGGAFVVDAVKAWRDPDPHVQPAGFFVGQFRWRARGIVRFRPGGTLVSSKDFRKAAYAGWYPSW